MLTFPSAPCTLTLTFASPERVVASVAVMSSKCTVICFVPSAKAGIDENARHAAIASVPILALQVCFIR